MATSLEGKLWIHTSGRPEAGLHQVIHTQGTT